MIDYDGIRAARNAQLDESELRLISSVVEAMQEGEIPSVDIDFQWVICHDCRGEGTSSGYLGVISPDTWNDWSDDQRDGYMTGSYDRGCTACSGTGKVQEMDEESLPEAVQKYINDYREDAHNYAMESYYERLAGC
jgi:hypothetical protein